MLFEAGLAYRAESMVNYDPVDQTVLANEQVDANGRSWRSGAQVEQRNLRQWFLRISAYRKELLDDLEHLRSEGCWPDRVLNMQEKWIGKSEGANIMFPVVSEHEHIDAPIEAFTTRPDTLLGVQYLALSCTHPLVTKLAKKDGKLREFVASLKPHSPETASTVGYLLPSIRGKNPLANESGMPPSIEESLPIFVANYVLGGYGSGAVMGVPAHDSRDNAFWRAHKPESKPRISIVEPANPLPSAEPWAPFKSIGQLSANCGAFSGLPSEVASHRFLEILKKKKLGHSSQNWRLRDWLISRQRYWGTPIPIIHCGSCGPVAVPDHELPVTLPPINDWQKHPGGNPLETQATWVNVPCPSCGKPSKRETDTMDTFVDSSWYFMRFPDAKNTRLPFDPKTVADLLPVDIYVGGVEHAILHLLYARFITKFLAGTSLWPQKGSTPTVEEPFKRVITQGMVHGRTFTDPTTGRFLKPSEVDLANPATPVVKTTGELALISHEKMSKSKYNGVDPGSCIEKYGADATRAHILFQAPVVDVLNWDEHKILGITRWLDKVEAFISTASQTWYAQIGDAANDRTAVEFFRLHKTIYDFVSVDNLQLVDPIFETQAGRRFWPRERVEVVKKYAQHEHLWRQVQATLTSVTNSYSNTFALNTIVSDLMQLTKVILETHGMEETLLDGRLSQPFLLRQATVTLLQMMAPITPGFAERCWKKLYYYREPGLLGSIFDRTFPETDGSDEFMKARTQTCAVQINGKLRVTLQIPLPSTRLGAKDLPRWARNQIKSDSGAMKKLEGFNLDKAKEVYVVKNGRLVNFVFDRRLNAAAGL